MYTEQQVGITQKEIPRHKTLLDGSEWGDGVIGGEMLFPRFAARFMDSVITGIILFLVSRIRGE